MSILPAIASLRCVADAAAVAMAITTTVRTTTTRWPVRMRVSD